MNTEIATIEIPEIDADTAKKVITLIAKKQVPNVAINY